MKTTIELELDHINELLQAARDQQAHLLMTANHSKDDGLADAAWERHQKLNAAANALLEERVRFTNGE